MLIVDPSAEYTVPRLTPAARLATLRGKRVWFLDNQGEHWGQGTPRMNPIFRTWATLLERDHGITWQFACTEQFVSPFRHGKEKFEEVARTADAVINGLACCGGGTSAVIHDAIAYEQRGVPTVSLVTDSALHHAKAATLKLGMPALAILTVSHNVHMFAPVVGEEESARAAEAIYPDVVRALVAR